MKKIVIIGGVTDFQLITGGVNSVVHNLLSQFKNYSDYEFYLYGNKVKEKTIGNIHFKNLYLPIKALGIGINFLLFGKKIIKQIDNSIKPDLFHFQGTIPNLFLLNNRVKNRSIFTQHAIIREEFKYQTNLTGKIKFYFKFISEKFLIKKVKNFIFISNYNQNYVRSHFKFKNGINFRKIYNPVNEIFFNKATYNKRYNTLYFIGEIKKRKGLHDLLSAISNLKKEGILYHLHIIGDFKDNIYKTIINKQIEESILKEQIFFHGWKSPNEIIKIIQELPIFILPSYQETLPVSVAEAMALGKTIIATNLPGIKELIQKDCNALLFNKGNIRELEAILKDIYLQEEKINRFGDNVRKIATELFHPGKIAKETIEFYKYVIEHNTGN